MRHPDMIQVFLIYHCIPLVALPKHCQLSHSRSQHLYSPNNQRKMQGRKSVDDIKAMHLAVLQKEQIKLDLEIENLHLRSRKKCWGFKRVNQVQMYSPVGVLQPGFNLTIAILLKDAWFIIYSTIIMYFTKHVLIYCNWMTFTQMQHGEVSNIDQARHCNPQWSHV